MGIDSDFNKSQENADGIEKFLKEDLAEKEQVRIVSVIGSWGTGKSTIKGILRDRITTNNKIIVASYDALQFEEKSQVTSELYNVISNELKWYNLCLINKFRSAAQLKKESNTHSISTSQIWSIFIVGLATFLLTKFITLPELNNLFNMLTFGVKVQNPILGNKLSLGFFILLMIFLFRNLLLQWIAGLLPRKSHVDILKSIKLNKQLVLLIDEVDRLSSESTKLLFDEILIIKSSLEHAKVDFKIFMFYDEDVVLHNYQLLQIHLPHLFLQKFYDRQYRLPRVFFLDDLNSWATSISQRNSSILHCPSGEIIREIALNIYSFREKDRLLEYFNLQLPRFLSDDTIRSAPLDVDVFIFSISLRFFFDLKQFDNDGNKVYSIYLAKGITVFKKIYNIPNEDLEKLVSEELVRLSKPFASESSSQELVGKEIILNTSNTSAYPLNEYCHKIVTKLDYFNWKDFNWATANANKFYAFLIEKNFNFVELISKLSEHLQATISQNVQPRRYTGDNDNYSIEYIKRKYIQRIECITFFLYLYLKLDNPIVDILTINFSGKLDSLIICAILKFKLATSAHASNSIVVDSFLQSATSNEFSTEVLSTIRNIVSNSEDINHILDDSFYLYQVLDLVSGLDIEFIYRIYGNGDNIDRFKNKNILLYSIIFKNNPLKIDLRKLVSELFPGTTNRLTANTTINQLLIRAREPIIEDVINREDYQV